LSSPPRVGEGKRNDVLTIRQIETGRERKHDQLYSESHHQQVQFGLGEKMKKGMIGVRKKIESI